MAHGLDLEHGFLQHATLLFAEVARGADEAETAPARDAFLGFVEQHGEALDRWLGERLSATGNDALGPTLTMLGERAVSLVHGQDQFIVVDEASRRELETLYRTLLDDVRAALVAPDQPRPLKAGLRAVLAGHEAGLRNYLDALWRANLGHSLTDHSATGQSASGQSASRSVCSQYSAELQCTVLGVDVAELMQPVLDLGCGPHARLVRYLGERGIEATGVDRGVDGDVVASHDVVETDWFAYELGVDRWGTIVSHMGVSNHFLHHHHRAQGHPERYARLYMRILRALRPGGRFVYAPGVPFFEALLPQGAYAVHKIPVAEVAGSEQDRALQAAFGASVFYACHVLRR